MASPVPPLVDQSAEFKTLPAQYPVIPVILERSTQGIISSKSPCHWTKSDLFYFRIYPQVIGMDDFFKNILLRNYTPEPGFEDFLTTPAADFTSYQATNYATQAVRAALLHIQHIHFKDRFSTAFPYEALSNCLAESLLSFVGIVYQSSRYVMVGSRLDLTMCGHKHMAEVDVAVVNNIYKRYTFFLVEDKRVNERNDPIAQLVANSIAAFQNNNRIRNALKIVPLKTMIFPAMTFRGSSLCFYLLQITKALSDAIINGVSPYFSTAVFLMRSPIDLTTGLFDPEVREHVLHVLENMKVFVPTAIKDIPVGWKKFTGLSSDKEFELYEPGVGSNSVLPPKYNLRPRKTRNARSI